MKLAKKYIVSIAAFSPCHSYRYSLTRQWDGGLAVLFVGLNASTADEKQDDPTIRRCVAFARDWGYGRLHMANLFGFRATQPVEMRKASDPVGPDNDRHLVGLARDSALIVAAWGVHGTFLGRDASVRKLLPRLHYLRLTKNGHPEHPLYLPKTLKPVEWQKDL